MIGRKHVPFLLSLFPFLAATAEGSILPRENDQPRQRHCHVSIAAIFQNEAPYLQEWIEYHKLIGVKHFYLYNNLSVDNFEEVLQPYVESGEVELFDIPVKLNDVKLQSKWQIAAYDHALKLSRDQAKWLACIDIDEFIVLKKADNLYKFLRNYENAGGPTIHWVMFGTSGVYDLLPGELLIEKLTWRFPLEWKENRMVKSIVRPKYTERCLDVHTFKYAGTIFAVYPNQQKFNHTPPYKIPPVDEICLHHYWYRTEKFFYETKLPRRKVWAEKRTTADFQEEMKLSNSIEDKSMLRFVAPLKKRLKECHR